jgi:peptidyl-prolyl cis-trans isomerase D
MLDTLRRYSQKWITKFLLGLAVLIFVVGFGILSSIDPTQIKESAIVVYVDEIPITNKHLDLMYERLYRRYQEQLGEQLNETLLKQLNLKFQALSMLINRKVVKIEAGRLGFLATDDEVRAAIARYPFFHNEKGEFDPQIYLAVLAQQRPRVTPQEFEEEQREQILLDKVEVFVRDLIHIGDAELVQDYILDRKEVDLSYLVFSAEDYKARIRISPEEVELYYRNHPEEFTSGTRLKLRVVRFPLEEWAKEITIPEEELKNAYEKNKDQYRRDEEVKASHILLRLPPQAPPDMEKEVLARMERLREKIERGAEFSELAKKYSEDPGTRDMGGELGWFGRGRMVKEFEEAAFSAPTGTVTGPVRTPYGYHLIYVQDHRSAGIQPFSEVRWELEQGMRMARARERAETLAEKLRNDLQNGVPFEKAIIGDLRVVEEEVAENDPKTLLKYPKEIYDRLFGGPPLSPQGEVFKYGDRPYYIQVLEKLPPIPRPLSEVAPSIRQKLLEDRAIARAAEEAQSALRDLKTLSPEKVAQRYQVPLRTTGPFNLRKQEVPGIGKVPEILQAAFRLTPQNFLPGQTFRVGNQFYVIRYRSSHEPTPEEFQKEKEERYRKLLAKKGDLLWQEWLTRAKQETSIKLENPPSDLLPPSG